MMISLSFAFFLGWAPIDEPACVVIVRGASGEAEYEPIFREAARRWRVAAEKGGATPVEIGDGAGEDDLESLRAAIETQPPSGTAPLWIVLIGHGTFDGREAKFNLRGPDLTDALLEEWLRPFDRPLAIVNCASASGPFVNRLSGPNRVVVAATRGGDEQNFTRFNQYLAESIGDSGADLDKDGQVSLLEAFLAASGRVEEYYKTEARLSTEHALIDDNGDRLGTPADWYRGVWATKRAKAGAAADGPRAQQLHLVPGLRDRALSAEARTRRDHLELAVAALRGEKERLSEADYYDRLEPLMIELARLYRAVD